jgi:hypothetical protein
MESQKTLAWNVRNVNVEQGFGFHGGETIRISQRRKCSGLKGMGGTNEYAKE